MRGPDVEQSADRYTKKVVMRYTGMKLKADARKLDQSTQAHLRKMVVQAVRDGMTQVDAKFWLKVFNELKTRGCQDILIAVVDGLKGLTEAIRAC
ncbi:hypothetical protein WK13_16125 [Burkholderia ubonensis]|nr:hypothetical protein WK13_16125 [Burkholderia ubonensis]